MLGVATVIFVSIECTEKRRLCVNLLEDAESSELRRACMNLLSDFIIHFIAVIQFQSAKML